MSAALGGQLAHCQKVALALSRIVAERGTPISITVDDGTEFVSKAMDGWAYQHGVQLEFIRPGRPVENTIESFNGWLRDECLNVEVFFALTDVRDKLEHWRQDYKQVRPHSALRDGVPAVFAAQWTETAVPGPACSGPDDKARSGQFTGDTHLSLLRAEIAGRPDWP